MRKSIKTAIAMALSFGVASSASASLIGDSADFYASFGLPSIAGFEGCKELSVCAAALGAGDELTLADQIGGTCRGGANIDLDPTMDKITLTGFKEPAVTGVSNYEHAVFEITGLDWVGVAGMITDLTAIGVSTLFDAAGFIAAPVISWTDDSVRIEYGPTGGPDFDFLHGGKAMFEITASHAVPAPAGLGLVLLGLIALRRTAR